MFNQLTLCIAPVVFAVYIPMCAPVVTPAQRPSAVHLAQLWEPPGNLEDQDLFYGPWGHGRAPDPQAVYRFVAKKDHGTNPGVTVVDPGGHEWSVKQAPADARGAEGPVEVVLSRVLSAVGYHQPPVYYMPSFTMDDGSGPRRVPGGRFRLKVPELKRLGEWSWQDNPFVGTQPYQGLLVILMMFESSDLKNTNNTVYEVHGGSGPRFWYVVRDLGTALGETGKLAPRRSDPELFERSRFITGVSGGFVEFNYRGWHQELVRQRIRPEDVQWASDLLRGLRYEQWTDAFLAGGYDRTVSERFVRRMLLRIRAGERVQQLATR